MTSKSNTTFRVAALALLAVAVGGCTQHQQSDAQSTAAPAASAAASAAAQPTAVAVQATTLAAQPAASTTGVAMASLASSDGDQAGTKVVVNSLVRGSDTLTLKFTLVNNSSKVLGTYARFYASPYQGYRTMSGINLIDTVSKKKYFPIADTENNCICSQDVDDVAPQSQTPLWVKFPAPPPGVTKITVEVPHFIPLDDVPITQ
jgi:hypothetical protein